MNRKQYIRLSIVLAVPTLAFSIYLGQEDLFSEKDQFVQCDVSNLNCSPVIKASMQQTNNSLRYFVYPTDRLLLLYNIDYPLKIYFQTIDNETVDVSNLVNSKTLETSYCHLWANKDISCGEIRNLPSNVMTQGKIVFINPKDEIAFNNVVAEGESYFKDYTFNRIIEGFLIFLFFAIPYLILSWLIHFIIYGASIGIKNK